MKKEEIVQKIVEWEHKHGESFIDRYASSNLNPQPFMAWCLGKGYMTREKYNLWQKDYVENRLESEDANYYLYNTWEEDCPYAVVISEEDDEKERERALSIYAEFMLQSDMVLQKALEELDN